jgi:hypothetical protein
MNHSPKENVPGEAACSSPGSGKNAFSSRHGTASAADAPRRETYNAGFCRAQAQVGLPTVRFSVHTIDHRETGHAAPICAIMRVGGDT